MAKLISAVAWDKFHSETIRSSDIRDEYSMGYRDAFDRVDDWMDAQLKVDAVPVIRCKNCKKRYTEDCLMQYTDYSEDMDANPDGISVEWTDDNDFCSYGERRTDERKAD